MSDTGQGLFSGAEVESLMRVEFERARRHKFPLVCMRVAIDRIDQLHDLYGVESKDEILRAVTALMRDSMRDSDHLGITQDDRFLAVFPHTTPETGQMLAKRLIANARKMRFERDGRSLRISLSVGVAHNKDEAATSFETLLAVADDGLAVADAGGGDRFVETELYALYANKKKRGGMDSDKPLIINAPARPLPAAPHEPTREELVGKALLEKLMSQGFDIDALAGMPPDMIAQAIRAFSQQKNVVEAGAGSDADKGRQIDQLERRIAKLTHVLGITEDELRRVATMKGIDLGLASIYSTVQGLATDTSLYEQKREMMKTIFEANFELKQKLKPGSGPGSPFEKK
ncbi:MAG: GGDEF domain-containing protein [Planctomycetota bacterium]|nr:GGDEF domain-containing protein [Planctomycetota bacterium]